MLNYYRQPRLFRKFADLRMLGGGAVAKTKLRKFVTIKLEQNQTDITSGDNDKRFDAAKKSNAVRDILKPAKCEPTEILLELMSKDPVLRQKVARIQKEYEIYEYFSEFIPTRFTDKNWLYLLRTTSIRERVSYWWYMGLTHFRESNDIEMKKEKLERRRLFFNELEKKYDNGEMAYGPNLYRMLYTPNRARIVRTFSALNALQLYAQELPQLLFDCQFLSQQNSQEYNKVGKAAFITYYCNYHSRSPFPSAFINVKPNNLAAKNFIKSNFDGFGKNKYEKSDLIQPDIYSDNPFHNPRETDPREQVIYISRYAKELLDGPLIHRAYVLPFTFDCSQETVAAIRRGQYRAMALPIDRYMKWGSGPKALAFPVIVNILQEVANNGGDWARAFRMYIPIHKRLSTEERREKIGFSRDKKLRDDRNLRLNIGDYIHETLGKQPAVFMHGSKIDESATLKEYANRLERF